MEERNNAQINLGGITAKRTDGRRERSERRSLTAAQTRRAEEEKKLTSEGGAQVKEKDGGGAHSILLSQRQRKGGRGHCTVEGRGDGGGRKEDIFWLSFWQVDYSAKLVHLAEGRRKEEERKGFTTLSQVPPQSPTATAPSRGRR